MKSISLVIFIAFMSMAAYVPNSVTSLGSKRRIEHVTMSGTSCTASPCTVAFSSNSGTTITRSGVGGYPLAWGTAWSSANYTCTLTSLNNAAAAFGIITAKSASGITITSIKPSDEQNRDASYDVICMGPR